MQFYETMPKNNIANEGKAVLSHQLLKHYRLFNKVITPILLIFIPFANHYKP